VKFGYTPLCMSIVSLADMILSRHKTRVAVESIVSHLGFYMVKVLANPPLGNRPLSFSMHSTALPTNYMT
jgi:hypothetical protein